MKKEAFAEAVSALEKQLAPPQESLSGREMIDPSRFHTISQGGDSAVMLACIDGGNAEILGTPEFSLHFIRAVAIVFQGRKKVKTVKKESLALVKVEESSGKLSFACESFGSSFPPLRFSADEVASRAVGQLVSPGAAALQDPMPGSIGSLLRRCFELELAKEVLPSLSPGSALLLDGNLAAKSLQEKASMDSLKEKAAGSDMILAALAKTNSQLTGKGKSIIPSIRALAPKGAAWCYPLSAHDGTLTGPHTHNIDTAQFLVRLHKNAQYIFRLELAGINPQNTIQDSQLPRVCQLLCSQSKDPILLGYPYGMIEADRLARVSNSESKYLAAVLLGKSAHLREKLLPLVNSLNAHTILDRIQF
ncbi:hypothetical protein HYU14_05275 [Candidatus Woesearchaeota archaeon]|nr:hypothetical protein [Candidatus Woesearchaeota archaeon]